MQSELLAVDHLFAKKIFPTGSQLALNFLAHLLKSAREGHLCLTLNEITSSEILQGFSALPSWIFETFLIQRENRIYLKRNWECEETFITHLKRLENQEPCIKIDEKRLQDTLDNTFLNLEQKNAIYKAASQCLTLITGGPGTGKTYVATVLLRVFHEAGTKDIVVAAPTGKATANIRQALGVLAEQFTFKTLHGLLKKKALTADLILVDEASMVDAECMTALWKAVKNGARLVLLGDKDQLPPINLGNFFSDLAREDHRVAQLHVCLRTELKEVIELAHHVRQGISIPVEPLPEPKILIEKIIRERMQVLTPLRKGIYGVDHLNQLLYYEYQKRGERQIPILITVNEPHLQLFNGDVGFWVPEEKCAYFSENRKIPESLLPRHEYAYVLSVHKSQGSEYGKVMILLPKGAEVFGREMLYTAITRAKEHVTLYAHEEVLERVLKNHFQRESGLIYSS